jgi:ring-1,2-phenylacetyl-CoA epoxidase subunit PaaB
MKIKSLDPRITRAGIPDSYPEGWQAPAELDQHETYEVFHIEKRGQHPVHCGSLHAPTPEIALLFAKEQYGRRYRTFGLWVVRTADISVLGLEEDADIFTTAAEKDYREAKGYRVGNKITKFKQERQQAASEAETKTEKQ